MEHSFSLGEYYLYLNLGLWGFLGLATVPLYGIGVIIFALALFYYGFYLRVANAYAFTNRRILIHRGWLSTSMMSVDYSQVTDVHASENFIERIMLHTGQLHINTAGTAVHEIVLTRVGNPYKLKQKLTELMNRDEAASRAVTHIASLREVK